MIIAKKYKSILSPAQVTPLPLKPEIQAQVKPPRVFVHTALESQLSIPSEHSSTSEITILYIIVRSRLQFKI